MLSLRSGLATAASLLGLVLPTGQPVAAATAAPLACAPVGDMTVCSGRVPSFDQTPLDVDLTLPSGGGRHPLIVMLHGFGNDKHEWESTTDTGDGADKWHWNSHWFAQHGYYVLTYTARGFNTKPPSRADEPNTPAYGSASLPNGTIHLKSREFEGRDTMYLAALMAAAHPDLDPGKVAVTGGSYGGGESWLLAATPTWDVGGGLPVLQLQVAVPKYPWSDLGYSLAPNGHPGFLPGDPLYSSSTGRPDDPGGAGAPVGVPKASYVTGFYAEGNADGIFEAGTTTTPSQEGKIDVHAWFDRVMGVPGDPYELPDGTEDPLVAQLRRGLTVYRSAYYQQGWAAQVGQREVAVDSISGWTDDLFPPVESFRMFKLLKGLDPDWPVAVSVADVGHPRAQNKPSQWQRLNDQAWQFVQSNINGSHRQQTTVSSMPTICGSDEPGSVLTASTPEGLSAGRVVVQFANGGMTTSGGGAGDPNGPATDPVTGGGTCRQSPGPAVGGYSATSNPVPHSVTMVGIGSVQLSYLLAGPEASVDVRLWDVDPSGTALLVSRGAYRLDALGNYDSAAGKLAVPFFGNHWVFAPGHRLRLDITQADSPAFRASTAPSTITFEAPTMVLPTRESGQVALTGA